MLQEATDGDIAAMINMPESQIDNAEDEVVAETATATPAETPSEVTAPAGNAVPEGYMSVSNMCSVSDLILQNVDKHIKMQVMNDVIHGANGDADVVNYIVYVNTDKKIPCIFDCDKLYLPKAYVQNADGTWNVTSIEGRRSGMIIKCPGRDIVMTKNFVYVCEMDENNKITSVFKYSRVHKDIAKEDKMETLVVEDYDSAVLLVRQVLVKLVKCGKYTTIETLREAVQKAYNDVDDINAMKNIIELRLKIGC